MRTPVGRGQPCGARGSPLPGPKVDGQRLQSPGESPDARWGRVLSGTQTRPSRRVATGICPNGAGWVCWKRRFSGLPTFDARRGLVGRGGVRWVDSARDAGARIPLDSMHVARSTDFIASLFTAKSLPACGLSLSSLPSPPSVAPSAAWFARAPASVYFNASPPGSAKARIATQIAPAAPQKQRPGQPRRRALLRSRKTGFMPPI